METKPTEISGLTAEQIPDRLKYEFYFDFSKHPFAHSAIFDTASAVTGVLDKIELYSQKWISAQLRGIAKSGQVSSFSEKEVSCNSYGKFNVVMDKDACFQPAFVLGLSGKRHTIYLGRGTSVIGSYIYLDKGDIWLGNDNFLEPGAGIRGSAIIGNGNAFRQGAYLRGNVIIGNDSVFRGEIKNSLIMDNSDFPHPSYLGDSICGYKTHFGNQATTANLGIYTSVTGKKNVTVKLDGQAYDLGRHKMGIVLGDFSQIGCNSVSDPGTFLGPNTIVYQLTRINKGFYGPSEVLKNKPMENRVIERGSLHLI